MTSISEVSLAPKSLSAESAGIDDPFGPTFSSWKPVELPPPTRPSPTPLVVLALLAGLGAMVLGGVAVVAATRSSDGPAVVAQTPKPTAQAAVPRVERRALALLSKPSTDRVAFRGSHGHLVLVVGSGGRAAILVRGFGRAPSGGPHYAWVVGSSGKPVRAGSFVGTERAVFLSETVGRKDSVVVAPDRAAALRPASARLVAARG